MSLGNNIKSITNGNKILSLSYYDGKYSITYQHGTQKYNMKNNIDDLEYANYIFDQLYEDIFRDDFFGKNYQIAEEIEVLTKEIESDARIAMNALGRSLTGSITVNSLDILQNINKLKQLVEKLK